MVTRRFTVVLEPAEEGGLLLEIIAEAGMTKEQFLKLLEKL